VIPVPPGVRVLIATRPVDFRKGADSLAALAKETLAQDPFSGAVLVFRSRLSPPSPERSLSVIVRRCSGPLISQNLDKTDLGPPLRQISY